MDRRTYLRTMAVVGTGTIAGCSGGDTSENGGGTNDGVAETSDISMVDTSFDPAMTAVAVDTTVTWTNEDGFAHDVVAATLTDAGEEWSFESGNLDAGDSTQYTFEEAGAYEYVCTIHGGDTMCGVILVGDPEYGGTLPCEDDGNPGGGVY